MENKVYVMSDIHGRYDVFIKMLNNIAIDCGCVFGRRLACLRLNDLEEYYVEVNEK